MREMWRFGGLSPGEIARRVWLDIYEGSLFTRTAALSYYFLLALFPLLLCLTTVLGFLAERGTRLRGELLGYFSRVLPGSAYTLIYTTVDEISANATGGKLSFSLLAALWAASSGVVAIGDGLNGSYGVRESRAWWRVRIGALGLTIALAVLILFSLALVLYGGELGSVFAEYFSQGEEFIIVWGIAQVPLMIVFVLLAFALLFYFAPDLREQRWYWITPGSLIGVALWLAVSSLFRLYLRYFDSYSVTYGSLGAVIVLMLWFYLTGATILIGGKINAEVEQAAARAGVSGAKLRGERAPEEVLKADE